MFEIIIKTLDGRDHPFSIEDETTIAQFKERIAAAMQIPVVDQRLLFRGRVLPDSTVLRADEMAGKVVHLVTRPPTSSRTNPTTDPTTVSSTPSTISDLTSTPRIISGADLTSLIPPARIQQLLRSVMGNLGFTSEDADITITDMGNGPEVQIEFSNSQSRPIDDQQTNPMRIDIMEYIEDLRGYLPRLAFHIENAERSLSPEGSSSDPLVASESDNVVLSDSDPNAHVQSSTSLFDQFSGVSGFLGSFMSESENSLFHECLSELVRLNERLNNLFRHYTRNFEESTTDSSTTTTTSRHSLSANFIYSFRMALNIDALIFSIIGSLALEQMSLMPNSGIDRLSQRHSQNSASTNHPSYPETVQSDSYGTRSRHDYRYPYPHVIPQHRDEMPSFYGDTHSHIQPANVGFDGLQFFNFDPFSAPPVVQLYAGHGMSPAAHFYPSFQSGIHGHPPVSTSHRRQRMSLNTNVGQPITMPSRPTPSSPPSRVPRQTELHPSPRPHLLSVSSTNVGGTTPTAAAVLRINTASVDGQPQNSGATMITSGTIPPRLSNMLSSAGVRQFFEQVINDIPTNVLGHQANLSTTAINRPPAPPSTSVAAHSTEQPPSSDSTPTSDSNATRQPTHSVYRQTFYHMYPNASTNPQFSVGQPRTATLGANQHFPDFHSSTAVPMPPPGSLLMAPPVAFLQASPAFLMPNYQMQFSPYFLPFPINRPHMFAASNPHQHHSFPYQMQHSHPARHSLPYFYPRYSNPVTFRSQPASTHNTEGAPATATTTTTTTTRSTPANRSSRNNHNMATVENVLTISHGPTTIATTAVTSEESEPTATIESSTINAATSFAQSNNAEGTVQNTTLTHATNIAEQVLVDVLMQVLPQVFMSGRERLQVRIGNLNAAEVSVSGGNISTRSENTIQSGRSHRRRATANSNASPSTPPARRSRRNGPSQAAAVTSASNVSIADPNLLISTAPENPIIPLDDTDEIDCPALDDLNYVLSNGVSNDPTDRTLVSGNRLIGMTLRQVLYEIDSEHCPLTGPLSNNDDPTGFFNELLNCILNSFTLDSLIRLLNGEPNVPDLDRCIDELRPILLTRIEGRQSPGRYRNYIIANDIATTLAEWFRMVPEEGDSNDRGGTHSPFLVIRCFFRSAFHRIITFLEASKDDSNREQKSDDFIRMFKQLVSELISVLRKLFPDTDRMLSTRFILRSFNRFVNIQSKRLLRLLSIIVSKFSLLTKDIEQNDNVQRFFDAVNDCAQCDDGFMSMVAEIDRVDEERDHTLVIRPRSQAYQSMIPYKRRRTSTSVRRSASNGNEIAAELNRDELIENHLEDDTPTTTFTVPNPNDLHSTILQRTIDILESERLTDNVHPPLRMSVMQAIRAEAEQNLSEEYRQLLRSLLRERLEADTDFHQISSRYPTLMQIIAEQTEQDDTSDPPQCSASNENLVDESSEKN